VETGCQGGQRSPRAVAPGGWMDGHLLVPESRINFHRFYHRLGAPGGAVG